MFRKQLSIQPVAMIPLA